MRDHSRIYILIPRFVLFTLNWLLRAFSYMVFTISAYRAAKRAAAHARPDRIAAYGCMAVPAAKILSRKLALPLVVRLFGVSLGMKGFSALAQAAQFEETLAQSMAINNLFLSIFAGVIAFAIIYNTTAISLTERTRELASLRVLGFTLGEIRRIVFGQNVLLASVGLALGIPLGALLCRWLVLVYETDLYRLPFHITRGTIITTALSIALFVFVANMASRRRIGRLDMVEVLKRRE